MATTSKKNEILEVLNELHDIIAHKPWFKSVGIADEVMYVYVSSTRDQDLKKLVVEGFKGFQVRVVAVGKIRPTLG